MKILLTGASGFIGTNFILRFYKNYEIVALVRENSNTKLLDSKCEIAIYDGSLESLERVFREHSFDCIMHLATSWINNPRLEEIRFLIDSNITFGVHLLEMSKKYHISYFINASSFGCYCNSISYRPSSLYAASKMAFEKIMSYYALVSRSVFCSLVIFNVYGEHDTKDRLFNLLDRSVESSVPLELSDGSQIVDYSYVGDVALGFNALLELLSKDSEYCRNKIFSLRRDERCSLKELVLLYEELLGKKLNILWGARDKRELEILTPWEGGERLPNYNPKYSLREGLSAMITSRGGVVGVKSLENPPLGAFIFGYTFHGFANFWELTDLKSSSPPKISKNLESHTANIRMLSSSSEVESYLDSNVSKIDSTSLEDSNHLDSTPCVESNKINPHEVQPLKSVVGGGGESCERGGGERLRNLSPLPLSQEFDRVESDKLIRDSKGLEESQKECFLDSKDSNMESPLDSRASIPLAREVA